MVELTITEVTAHAPSPEAEDLSRRLLEAMSPELEGEAYSDVLSATLHAAMCVIGSIGDEASERVTLYRTAAHYFTQVAKGQTDG